MKLFLLSIALLASVVYVTPAEDGYQLTESITNCDQDSPDLNECVKKSMQDLWATFHKGNQDYGIPSLDPFTLPDQRFDFRILGGIQGSLAFKGLKIYGMSRSRIDKTDVVVTDDGAGLDLEFFLPRVFADGKYKAEVNINDFKMTPKGYFNLTMAGLKITAQMSGKYKTINNEKHLILDFYDANMDSGDMKFYATGLLPDPVLNNVALDLVNQYWAEILRIGIPETKDQWGPIIMDAINEFLKAVPFNKLLSRRLQ